MVSRHEFEIVGRRMILGVFAMRGSPKAAHRAVVHHMQIALQKVDDATAGGVFYVGVSNVPLFGNRPVEDLCPRCHLVDR